MAVGKSLGAQRKTGAGWPRKDIRSARLRECVDVIRALLRGEEVSHDGLVTVDRARLWTLPPEEPPPDLARSLRDSGVVLNFRP